MTEPELIVRDKRVMSESGTGIAIAPAVELKQSTVLLQVIARAAQDRTIDLDRMERLLVMQERMNAKVAEQEFIDALARFKQNPPKIVKDATVDFTSPKGRTYYRHASLGAVCTAAIQGLAAVGISHRWDLEQKPGGRIAVTCVLSHIGGHSTKTMLEGSPDESGNKNNIQQVSSTITYLQRYTLLAATGLATEDQDDDGRGAEDVETIGPGQCADLEAMIDEVKADRGRFLRYFKIESLDQLPLARFEAAIAMLNAKRKG